MKRYSPTMLESLKVLILLVTGLFFSMGCNEASKPKEQKTPQQKVDASIYPHSKDFNENFKGGSNENFHGSVFLKNRSQCMQCHGLDLKGQAAAVSCTRCHENYPHEHSFALPTNHGKIYLNSANKETSCLKCHASEIKNDALPLIKNDGSSLVGGKEEIKENNKPKCTDCHSAYPYAHKVEGFGGGGGDHGVLARGYAGKCTVCHTDFKKHLTDENSCSNCHETSKFQIWFGSKDTKSKKFHLANQVEEKEKSIQETKKQKKRSPSHDSNPGAAKK